jgi:ectoine hydroxylase-related dioxygenase (phytanoyl-CoA dioxygenase family)
VLTQKQIDQYHTFGCLILRNVLSAEDIDRLNAEFDAKLETTFRGEANGGKPIHCSWSNSNSDSPFTSSLLEDPRIYEIPEALFEDEVFGVSSTATSFIEDTPWHPDSDHFQLHGIKVLIYLEPLNGDNGALRVIPGSHFNPYHDELHAIGLLADFGNKPLPSSPYLIENSLEIKDVPAHICNVTPGDVIVFNFRIWHASTGGKFDRRFISNMFIKDPVSPEEREAVSELVETTKKNRDRRARDTFPNPDPEYHPDWLSNPDKNPKRQRNIDWIREQGYLEVFATSSTKTKN